jgi:hypothetical protein
MSKYINGVKGNQVSPHYKNKNDRLKALKAELAEATASGTKPDLVAALTKYIAHLAYRTKA